MSTELTLENWLKGQVSAERMCQHVLSVEGFENLDPQSPAGGPDGRKDILCTKNRWRYVAAAYFPTSAIKFTELKKKFQHDLEGVAKNRRDGLIFMTGQKISPGERKSLMALAEAKGHTAIIYHQERIRGVLDSPIGFGARLEHLGIPMRPEEQMAFVIAIRGEQSRVLEQMLARVEGKVDRLIDSSAQASLWQDEANRILTTLSPPRGSKVSEKPATDAATTEEMRKATLVLTIQKILSLHDVLMFESSARTMAGRFRDISVWIGSPGAGPDKARYTPPEPGKVGELMEKLVNRWNGEIDRLLKDSRENQIDAIARFHLDFLSIHPFADGNGRVCRYLVQLQAQVLGLSKHPVVISERAVYAKAIATAQEGDISALRALIQQAITGSDQA